MKSKYVVISDNHYSLNTLSLADEAFREAIDKAAELNVPLIDCGDLTNDKAVLRAEVMNVILDTFKYAKSKKVKIYCLVGNHSLINEKGKAHALNFLKPYATIIDSPSTVDSINFIPYQTDPEEFYKALKLFPKNSLIFAHQGVKEGNKGDYVFDHSAVDVSKIKGFNFISGHYHLRHSVKNFSFVGNTYTLSFGEANDGPKGFLVVNEDGTYKQIVLKMRKHRIIEHTIESLAAQEPYTDFTPQDLTWLKVKGPRSELVKLNKKEIGERLFGHCNFKFDKLPLDSVQSKKVDSNLTEAEILDQLISRLPESEPKKKELKKLWRTLLETA